MNKISRYICFFLAVIFLLFAAFQYNDQDGILWMGIYGIASIISFAVAIKRINKPIVITSMLAYLIGGIAQWPPIYEGFWQDMNHSIYIEQAREAGGLFLCFLAMVYYLILVVRMEKSKKLSVKQTS